MVVCNTSNYHRNPNILGQGFIAQLFSLAAQFSNIIQLCKKSKFLSPGTNFTYKKVLLDQIIKVIGNRNLQLMCILNKYFSALGLEKMVFSKDAACKNIVYCSNSTTKLLVQTKQFGHFLALRTK